MLQLKSDLKINWIWWMWAMITPSLVFELDPSEESKNG